MKARHLKTLTADERKLLATYRALPDIGQQYLRGQIEMIEGLTGLAKPALEADGRAARKTERKTDHRAMMLTINLTDWQRRHLHENIARLVGHPASEVIYTDADVLAGRWMRSPEKVPHGAAAAMIEALARDHHAPASIVAFLAGMAHGVRFGRTLLPTPKRPERPAIWEEYRRLPDDARKESDRLIRRLIRAHGLAPEPRKRFSKAPSSRGHRKPPAGRQ